MLHFLLRSFRTMEVNPEAGSEDENQSFDQLSFFSAFSREFKGMKETLAERVSSALENELEPSVNEGTPVSSDVLDSSVCTLDSGDEEDLPLFNRLQKEVHADISTRKTRSSRRGGRGGIKKTILSKAPPETTSEVIVLSDLDDGDDEVLCIDSDVNTPKTHELSTVDLNVSESADILEDSEEDDNAPVSVKINWMNLKMHRFELPKNQTFSTVFEELAKKENVPVDKILLILRDKIFISQNDSPASLNITVIDLIEGGVTKEAHKNVSTSEINKNMLEFKCVLKDQKKPLLVSIRKLDSMQCLMVKAAEELGCPLEKLKFKFEGEELEGEATPEDLDLEGGEVIEVIVKS